jgi:hypothetical protein
VQCSKDIWAVAPMNPVFHLFSSLFSPVISAYIKVSRSRKYLEVLNLLSSSVTLVGESRFTSKNVVDNKLGNNPAM